MIACLFTCRSCLCLGSNGYTRQKFSFHRALCLYLCYSRPCVSRRISIINRKQTGENIFNVCARKLHAAAQNGKTELAKILLTHGDDKKQLIDKVESAADIAGTKLHKETAAFIDNF